MTDYVPQFDAPFRIGPDGQPVTVPQDSASEIGAAIYNIVTCPQGEKLHDLDFGIPSPIFGTIPLDLDAIVNAVQSLEPRATITAVQQTLRLAQAQQPVTILITAQQT